MTPAVNELWLWPVDAAVKVPTSVHFLPSLPPSLTGKFSRARLRELGLTGQEEPVTEQVEGASA